MDTETFIARSAEMHVLHARGAYEAAYALAAELLAEDPHCASLLVRAAKLQQLLDRADELDSPVTLRSVRALLELAARVEPSATAPPLELGHLSYDVEDDPAAGLRHFERARALAESGLREATIGKIQCLIDLNELDLARSELQTAIGCFGPDVDLAELAERLDA